MKRIQSFQDFIQLNEVFWGDVILNQFGKTMKAAEQPLPEKPEKVDTPETKSTPTSTVSSTTSPRSTDAPVGAADFSYLDAVPGNDDFILYMQHQQGLAGAKGLLAASAGAGQIHPATLKRKGCFHLGTVPYANLQCNIPSDRPQYKRDIVAALDKGDQKTGATLFLKMWKEKWNDKTKTAKALIEKPQNAEVKNAIAKYCQKYGVPFDFAITVACIESGFNPKSGNKVYKGLFALSQSEFNKYVPGGNIMNLDDNANAGIQCLKNNIREFTKYLGPLIAKVEVGSWAKGLA